MLQAKASFSKAHELIPISFAQAISEFEHSRDLFQQAGNQCEAAIAETWAAQFLPDVGRIAESRLRFAAIIANAENRKFTLLLSPAYFWLAKSDFLQNRFSEARKNLKKGLQVAKASGNTFEADHAAESLVQTYTELGELEPSVSYAGTMLSHNGTTYETPSVVRLTLLYIW